MAFNLEILRKRFSEIESNLRLIEEAAQNLREYIAAVAAAVKA